MQALGYNIAVVTYDQRREIARFNRRFNFGYPLLADPQSKIIRAFGLIDTNYGPRSYAFGVARPLTLVIDAQGRVTHRFSESHYSYRPDPGDILKRIRNIN